MVAPDVDAIAAPDAGSEVFAPIVGPTGSEGGDVPAGGVMEIGLRTDRFVIAVRWWEEI